MFFCSTSDPSIPDGPGTKMPAESTRIVEPDRLYRGGTENTLIADSHCHRRPGADRNLRSRPCRRQRRDNTRRRCRESCIEWESPGKPLGMAGQYYADISPSGRLPAAISGAEHPDRGHEKIAYSHGATVWVRQELPHCHELGHRVRLPRVLRAALRPLPPKRSAGFPRDAHGPFHGMAGTGPFRHVLPQPFRHPLHHSFIARSHDPADGA